MLVLSLLSGWAGQVDPVKFWTGLPRFASYFHDILPQLRPNSFLPTSLEWFWNLDGWLALLCDTLLIAYLGTLSGAVVGFFLCFLMSANLTPSRAVRFAARRTLEFCRTVPELVFALMFVYALGFGSDAWCSRNSHPHRRRSASSSPKSSKMSICTRSKD